MTNPNRDKLIDKIRKLLALSTSPNENEAMAAAQKVQDLLAEHNLDMSDLEVAEADTVVDDTEAVTVSKSWIILIYAVVAELYFCVYVHGTVGVTKKKGPGGMKKMSNHHIIGEKHNVIVARLMADYLTKTVHRLSREASLDYEKGERTRFKRSFRNACSRRVAKRIEALIAYNKAKAHQMADGRNLPSLLPLYQKALVDYEKFKDKAGMKVGPSVTMIGSGSHLEGFAAGLEAGDRIGLNTQLSGKEQPTHLLSGPRK